jgi:cardiolipin synthase (CMP-forming)
MSSLSGAFQVSTMLVYQSAFRLVQLTRLRQNYALKVLATTLPSQTRHFRHNPSLKKDQFANSTTSTAADCKTSDSHKIIQNVLEKKRQLVEKKDVLVQDIKETRTKVKERVEEIIERENVWTVPNVLCVARGLLSPYIGYTIVCSDYTLAMGLLVFAGITDLADGYIARTWPSQASKMGSFLDPMADKLLMGSLVISLTYADLLPLWLTGMIVFRDLFLIGAGFVIRFKSLPPPVSPTISL